MVGSPWGCCSIVTQHRLDGRAADVELLRSQRVDVGQAQADALWPRLGHVPGFRLGVQRHAVHLLDDQDLARSEERHDVHTGVEPHVVAFCVSAVALDLPLVEGEGRVLAAVVAADVEGLERLLQPGLVGHDDRINNYFNIINPFDGVKAVYCMFSPRRLTCDNQIRGVVQDKASKMIRIKHSSQVETNLERVMDIVNMAAADFQANMEQYQYLARRQVNQEDVAKFVKKLWEVENVKPEDISTRTKNILDNVFKFIDCGIGQNVPSTRGSYFWLWQGVNGYLNHVDGKAENRATSLLCGGNANFDQKAFNLALEMAA